MRPPAPVPSSQGTLGILGWGGLAAGLLAGRQQGLAVWAQRSRPQPLSSQLHLGPQVQVPTGQRAAGPGALRAGGQWGQPCGPQLAAMCLPWGGQTPAGHPSEAVSPPGRTVCSGQPPHPRGGQQSLAVRGRPRHGQAECHGSLRAPAGRPGPLHLATRVGARWSESTCVNSASQPSWPWRLQSCHGASSSPSPAHTRTRHPFLTTCVQV